MHCSASEIYTHVCALRPLLCCGFELAKLADLKIRSITLKACAFIERLKMSSDSDSDYDCGEILPESIREIAKNVSLNLLPKRLKQVYTAAYNAFKKWRKDNGSNSFSQDVLLTYFFDLSKKYAPSSLWLIYFMLRTTIDSFNQVDISKYQKLICFLKKQSSGYKAKKSLIFTKEDIDEFLNEAPDDLYLCTKHLFLE